VNQTADGGWWLPLLEKAYAKVNVNYEQISHGSQAEAARFLTGAPAREFESNFQTADELWTNLQLNLDKDNVLTAACYVANNGLQQGYGYIIKGYKEITQVNKVKLRLIKLKSPWMKESNKENWTGRYGKKDKFWKLQDYKATAAELQEGEFWMAVEDFKDSFKYYSVAYLRSGWSNSFVEKRNA
jgi:hypothetical protein